MSSTHDRKGRAHTKVTGHTGMSFELRSYGRHFLSERTCFFFFFFDIISMAFGKQCYGALPPHTGMEGWIGKCACVEHQTKSALIICLHEVGGKADKVCAVLGVPG